MASIRRRKDKYQVQVRLNGTRICKTFNNLKDAKKWSTHQENKINLGSDLEVLDKSLSLSDLLKRYLREITPLESEHQIDLPSQFNRMTGSLVKVTEN